MKKLLIILLLIPCLMSAVITVSAGAGFKLINKGEKIIVEKFPYSKLSLLSYKGVRVGPILTSKWQAGLAAGLKMKGVLRLDIGFILEEKKKFKLFLGTSITL